MRIPCPYCGTRELGEFSYLGDAAPVRPAPQLADGPEAVSALYDYTYLRDNPAGSIRELWYHGGGCRAWLVVERDTRTHALGRVVPATGAGAGEASRS